MNFSKKIICVPVSIGDAPNFVKRENADGTTDYFFKKLVKGIGKGIKGAAKGIGKGSKFIGKTGLTVAKTGLKVGSMAAPLIPIPGSSLVGKIAGKVSSVGSKVNQVKSAIAPIKNQIVKSNILPSKTVSMKVTAPTSSPRPAANNMVAGVKRVSENLNQPLVNPRPLVKSAKKTLVNDESTQQITKEKPFYKNPIVIAGSAFALFILILLLKRK